MKDTVKTTALEWQQLLLVTQDPAFAANQGLVSQAVIVATQAMLMESECFRCKHLTFCSYLVLLWPHYQGLT